MSINMHATDHYNRYKRCCTHNLCPTEAPYFLLYLRITVPPLCVSLSALQTPNWNTSSPSPHTSIPSAASSHSPLIRAPLPSSNNQPLYPSPSSSNPGVSTPLPPSHNHSLPSVTRRSPRRRPHLAPLWYHKWSKLDTVCYHGPLRLKSPKALYLYGIRPCLTTFIPADACDLAHKHVKEYI